MEIFHRRRHPNRPFEKGGIPKHETMRCYHSPVEIFRGSGSCRSIQSSLRERADRFVKIFELVAPEQLQNLTAQF